MAVKVSNVDQISTPVWARSSSAAKNGYPGTAETVPI
jgi:hypothetical protein